MEDFEAELGLEVVVEAELVQDAEVEILTADLWKLVVVY